MNLIEKNNLQFVEHRVRESIAGDNIVWYLIFLKVKKVTVERINITWKQYNK